MKIQPLYHYHIQDAPLDLQDNAVEMARKVLFEHMAGEIDHQLYAEVRKTLIERGVTDLYVLNDDFIFDAISEKMASWMEVTHEIY